MAIAAEPIAITSCGQSFKGEAFLTGDLDCSGFAGSAVSIEKGTLDLKGFTITGGQLHGVVCKSRCTIIGEGGSILEAGVDGIHNEGTKLFVVDANIGGSGSHGIGAPESNPWEVRRSRVTVSGALIIGNRLQGINSRSATVANSILTGNGLTGVYVPKHAFVSGSEVSENGDDGIYAEGVARFVNSVSYNNGNDGVWGVRKVEIVDSDIFGNQSVGVSSKKARVTNSSITGNVLGGLRGSRWIQADDSTICGNGTDLFGLKSTTKIKIRSTACDGHQDCTICALD